MPLGFTIGLVPGSRRRNVLAVVAVAAPFAIETAQLLLPILGRGCQSADVFDNLTGLVVGWIVGAGARDPRWRHSGGPRLVNLGRGGAATHPRRSEPL